MVKRQSKGQWRKRGAELEDAVRTGREAADQDIRTGGALAKANDTALFSIEPSASTVAVQKKSDKRKDRGPLWVDRNVAANPNINSASELVSSARRPTNASDIDIAKAK